MSEAVDEAVADALDALQEAERALAHLRALLESNGFVKGNQVSLVLNQSVRRFNRMSQALRPIIQRAQTHVQRREALGRLGAPKPKNPHGVPLRTPYRGERP